ncbi:HTH-type transcriptional regulator GltR [compost metagenome]
MELRHLHTFLVVAESLSFTRTAETLNYAQSSITAQIQALEAELGVPLFERLGKRVRLSDAGKRMVTYAKRMVQLEEEARVFVPGTAEPSGVLMIGAPESLCAYRLPAVLSKYRQRYPRVQLIVRPGDCADLRRSVADGTLDLTFFLDQMQTFPSVQVEPLLSERILLVALPEHRLARRQTVEPSDIAGEVVLHTEAGCTYRNLFEQMLSEAGVRPETVMEFASIEAIKHCTMAGMGVAILPEIAVASEIARGSLVALPWFKEISVMTLLAVHKDKWLSPALSTFLEIARETIKPPEEAIR